MSLDMAAGGTVTCQGINPRSRGPEVVTPPEVTRVWSILHDIPPQDLKILFSRGGVEGVGCLPATV
eukprot:765418-Hanusia_phi.AAC.1